MAEVITQGKALDIATKHMHRSGEHSWSWARTKWLPDDKVWLVTLGDQQRPLWRLTLDNHGQIVSTETVML